VVAVFVQAVIRHDLEWVPSALGSCLALMCGSVACTGYLSARLPYAMRQSRKSMFANSIPGQKGRTLGSTLAAMGGGIVVALPAVVLTVLSLTGSPAWGWLALVVGPVCGIAAVVLMSNVTATAYLDRTPEILAVVALGDRS
jgi:ABC-2 type transport system permease protein